jgi:peptidoglycan/xylan/chitin deacetylase (PgdA/CDA1 family)
MLGLGAAAVGSVVAGCTDTASSPSGASDSAGSRAASSSESTSAPPLPPTPSHPQSAPARVPAGPAVEYAHGPRTRAEVALTFHGAGDPAIARQLLAIFARHHAQVTVLGVGTWLAANPTLAREIVAAGHELGNHTYSHVDIDSLGAQAAQAEIVRCRDLLVSLVGSGGAHFRQSQAQSSTPLVRRLAGAAGYPVCLSYDVDSLDYTDPGPAVVRQNVAAAQRGSIVSMHFGHPGTVTAMPQVLADLASRGMRPVTASTLLRP